MKKFRATTSAPQILLASSSPYRRELLGRLRIPFAWLAPEIDETILPPEQAEAAVVRLAIAKADAVSARTETRFVVASDQVAVLDGHIFGKPGNHAQAMRQLRNASGRRLRFLTGICVVDRQVGRHHTDCVPADVWLRRTDDLTLTRYLGAEQPYDCAGSIKCEALGITLIERFDCPDPTALLGLPLIRLTEMLRASGFDVLEQLTSAA